MTAPTTLPMIAGDRSIELELERCLRGFEFENGAVLVQVPQVPLDLLEPEVARKRGYFAYPPQGLLYLAATLRSLGIKTRTVDLNFVVLREVQIDGVDVDAAWRGALDEALSAFDKPFVCVSFMFDATFPAFQLVCEHVRGKWPGACIAAGGVAATADPERLLAANLVDLVFSQEGERTLERFYAYTRGQTSDLPVNLAVRGADGSVVRTPMLVGGEVDLDIRMEYEGIPIAKFHETGSLSNFSRMNGVDVPFATVLSRRGCRARCTFCGVRMFNGESVRVRDVEGVIEEMETLHHRHGIKHFDWLDDDLLYDGSSALALFDAIAERLPGITWAANNGLIAAAITPALMNGMERSGCIGFKVGLESGNAEVLRRVRKPLSLQRFYEFARLATGYPQMFVAVNFILGFPGEQFGQMLDSFKAALQGGMDWNNYYLYQPLKNTELYLTHGGLGDDDVRIEHGKDNQEPRIDPDRWRVNNPVRGGGFTRLPGQGVASGYEVFETDPSALPSRTELREIWFTFNHITNFLHMPALRSDSERRVRNGRRWIEVLSEAYPNDASMTCVLYYLSKRLADSKAGELEQLRALARAKLNASAYWRGRDEQFGFSALLDGEIPPLASRYAARFGLVVPDPLATHRPA